jgi:hypothetical protein
MGSGDSIVVQENETKMILPKGKTRKNEEMPVHCLLSAVHLLFP